MRKRTCRSICRTQTQRPNFTHEEQLLHACSCMQMMLLLLARASSSLFASLPSPAATKLKRKVTIQHADVQEANSVPAAALLQTRCRSLEGKKCTSGFCVQYPMNCKLSRVYWFFLLSGQTSTLPGRDPAPPPTAATSSLSPLTDACSASVSEAASQGGSAVRMP